MRLPLDKDRVSESFSSASANYDAWAAPQRMIARRLIDLMPEGFAPEKILEFGCGTGNLTEQMRGLWPNSEICAIDIAPGMIEECRRRWPKGEMANFRVCDAESFTSERRFDLLASSCAFQWFVDRAAAINNLRGLLAPGGRVAIAAPIRGTLEELAQSYSSVREGEMPRFDLWDCDQYNSALEEAGIKIQIAKAENLEFHHADAWEVLNAVKGIGAAFSRQRGFSQLSPIEIKNLVAAYHARYRRTDGNVVSTYRAYYAISEPIE